jgi:hypothetical protein
MSLPRWLPGFLTDLFDRQDVLSFLTLSYLAIRFRRGTSTDPASGMSLPFSMLKGAHDTLHIDHCARQSILENAAQ